MPAISDEDLKAHKAEWRATHGPDRVPPWRSKYGAAMDDKTQWPPIWKQPFTKCPEYQVLESYLIGIYPRILRNQIVKNRGYDVTVAGHGFWPYSPGRMREVSHISTVVCKYVTDKINKRAKKYGEFYVLDEVKKIVRARRPCFYTFTVKEATVDELKTVQAFVQYSPWYGKSLLIFVKEWRFKPKSK